MRVIVRVPQLVCNRIQQEITPLSIEALYQALEYLDNRGMAKVFELSCTIPWAPTYTTRLFIALMLVPSLLPRLWTASESRESQEIIWKLVGQKSPAPGGDHFGPASRRCWTKFAEVGISRATNPLSGWE